MADSKIPELYWGTSSVDDNSFDAVSRALQLCVLVKENRDTIIEAVQENPEIKEYVLRELDLLCRGTLQISESFKSESYAIQDILEETNRIQVNAGALRKEVDWFRKQNPNICDRRGICQCGTEKIIKESTDGPRMRAVLLVLSFIDQFVYTHYNAAHQGFKEEYSFPRLDSHGGMGPASPSWLVYTFHGYDKHADWTVISRIFNACTINLLNWLVRNKFIRDADEKAKSEFWDFVKYEIAITFESEHRKILLDALSA